MSKQITLTTIALLAAATLLAQKTPLEKYELVPTSFEQVYLDHISTFPCKTITSGHNEYVGQVDAKGMPYGYGRYFKEDGSQIYGKFRNGSLLFGITFGQHSVWVGNNKYHCSYSLENGALENISIDNIDQPIPAYEISNYAFVSMRYANGDQYVGETYQGMRHGFGIYYYANGDCWFGAYNRNIRQGHGVLFLHTDEMIIGQWDAEERRREIEVKTEPNVKPSR